MVDARAIVGGTIEVSLGGTISHNGNLTLELHTANQAIAIGEALAIGPVGGTGVKTYAEVSPIIKTYVAPDSHITVGGNFTIRTLSEGSAKAESRGIAAGALAVGVSLADAVVKPTVSTFIGAGSTINAGGAITIETLHNYDVNGNKLDRKAEAAAEASAGAYYGSGAGADASAESSANVSATVDSGAVLTAGPNSAVTIRALANNDAEATGDGIAVALGLAVGGVLADAKTDGSTQALLDGNVQQGGKLTVEARSADIANATTDAVAGGIVSGAGSHATTVSTPTINVSIAAGHTVKVTGDVTVNAVEENSSVAEANGVSAGGLTVGVSLATATATPEISASIKGGSVTSTGGNIVVTALNNLDLTGARTGSGAKATTRASSGGLLAGSGNNASATSSPILEASVGSSATLAAAQEIDVRSQSSNTADAKATGLGAGLVGIGVSIASASTGGSNTAHLDGRVEAHPPGGGVDATQSGASNVKIRALGSDNATARAQAVSGGVISGRGSDATATTTPVISAKIGSQTLINATGDVSVLAEYLPEADAVAKGYGGGVIDAGVSVASGLVSPSATASIGSGSQVNAGGNVSVVAQRANTGAQPVDAIVGVNGVQDTLTYGDFGLSSGSVVQYSSTNPIAGLSNGRDYRVLSSSTNAAGRAELKLGVQFDGSLKTTSSGGRTVSYGLDENFDVIRFAGAHGLVTGDVLVFDGSSGANLAFRNADGSTSALAAGQKVYVRVIDANTIKLFANAVSASNPALKTFAPNTSVNETTGAITLNGHGFANGEAVTYRNAVDRGFSGTFVDIQLDSSAQPATDSNGNVIVNDSDIIYFEQAHGYATGEAVQYHVSGGALIALEGGGALVDGGIYYAIKINDNALKLAASYYQAVGRADDTGSTGVNEAIAVVALDLVSSSDSNTMHTLSDPTLGGLQAGRTYYIVGATANTFQLAAERGGSAIVLDYLPDALATTKTQFIGREGLDLIATTGVQRLRIDIGDAVNSVPAGTQRLLGAGGVALGQVSPPAGDGRSAAAADASSGGLVTVADNTARVMITQDVTARSEASMTVGGNLTVRADSLTDASGNVTNASGGVIAVKFSDTSIAATSGATARLGGGSVDVAGAVTVAATNSSTQDAYARAQGGGLIDIAGGRATADFTPTTVAELGSGLMLRAGGALAVNATLAGNLRAESRVQAGGLGSDTDGDSSAKINTGLTLARVDDNANVQARAVTVQAQGSSITLYARTETDAGGVGVDNNADATASLTDQARVEVNSGVMIKGDRGVDLRAGHAILSVRSSADGDTDALGGDTDVNSTAKIDGDATVSTADGSRVTAGPRTAGEGLQQPSGYSALNLFVQTFGTSLQPVADLARSGAFIDVGGSHKEEDEDSTGAIVWDGDAAVTAGISPEITIAADGTVTSQAPGVSIASNGSKVSIGDIVNSTGGVVRFESDAIRDTVASSGNDFRQTFEFQDTFDAIKITNYSAKVLEINNIVTVGSALPQVDLVAPEVTLTFDVQRGVGPTAIDIANLAPSGGADLILAGTIANPIGSTRITALSGDIVARTDRGEIVAARSSMITTNSLYLYASQAVIGYDKDSTNNDGDDLSGRNRLNVDLVRKPGIDAVMTAVAGGDVYLDLKGRLRDPALAGDSATFTVDQLRAGLTGQGQLNVLLQTAVREPDAGGTVGKVRVLTPTDSANTGDTADNLYAAQFRPDDTAPPAAPVNSGGFYAGAATAIDALYNFGRTAGSTGLASAGSGAIVISTPAPAVNTAGSGVSVAGTSNVQGTGSIDVLTNRNITLNEVTGDLRIARVQSNFGNVSLTALDGEAYDTATAGDDGTTAWVWGNSVSISALGGAIGSAGDFLEVNSSAQADGLVDAIAAGSIFLRETTGDMRLGGAAALAGDVVLITNAGSILDAEVDKKADIQGANIDLVVTGGSIGTVDKSVDIYGAGFGQRPALQNRFLQLDYAVPGNGRLVADAANGVYINEAIAGLNLLRVTAGAGDVRITTNDSVSIDELTRIGDDNITLLAGGSTYAGAAISGGVAVEASGAVSVVAGDNVTVPVGTFIKSAVSVLVGGDPVATDFDADGTTIDIQGDLQAPDVTIEGGGGLDYLQINNANGINAGGATVMRGGAGSDRFFVRTVADGANTTLSLEGDAGADRFFLSSNASKALFTNGTAYNEPDDPLAFLKGDLIRLGGITVDAGTGGNGGTVDAIYVTSESAASPVTGAVSGGLDGTGATVGQITGFGMTGGISYKATDGIAVGVQLTKFDDTMAVDAVASTVYLAIDGSGGDDTLNVGQAAGTVAGIQGILSFSGGAGTDILNVFGDASSTAGQLSAVSITGMGMGSNRLVAVHNDNFGAGYNLTDTSWPGAIYYAKRSILNTTETVSSTVEAVNVQLGAGNDTFNIDSTYGYGVTTVRGGAGNDQLVVGSTLTGLHPTLRDRSRVVPRSDRACVFTKRFMRSENAGFTKSRRVIAITMLHTPCWVCNE